MWVRRAGALVASALLAALAVTLPATAARAHSVLIATNPAEGATVTTSLAEVTLTFNERVRGDFTTVVITGPRSRGGTTSYGDGHVRVVDDVVHQKIYPPRSGAYQVAWRAISADGHPVEGQFHFTVKLPPGAEPASDPPTPGQGGPGGSAASGSGNGSGGGVAWVVGSALALLVAAALVTWALWRPRRLAAPDPDDEPAGNHDRDTDHQAEE